MSLILGLGNPGAEYAHTRHNAGWMVLEEIEERGRFGRGERSGPARIRRGSLDGLELTLARPMTYMNESGRAGVHLARSLGIDVAGIVVVHDDVDIRFGRLRIRRGGSAGGHRGVASLIAAWRRPDFIRVRVGVGRPAGGGDTIDYVLSPFADEERVALPAVVRRAADATIAVVRDGLESAMNQFNREPPPDPPSA
jgi:PTH1 family peptidyl-tRNA hydrolase